MIAVVTETTARSVNVQQNATFMLFFRERFMLMSSLGSPPLVLPLVGVGIEWDQL